MRAPSGALGGTGSGRDVASAALDSWKVGGALPQGVSDHSGNPIGAAIAMHRRRGEIGIKLGIFLP
jgi:hypothetical protein